MIESSLTDQQKEKLEDMIKRSKISHVKFKCPECNTILNSLHAIKYHVKNRHILKALTNETMWVSQRVREGKQEIREGAVVNIKWHCHMCKNISYKSHQAFRAHMKLHYAKLFKSENGEDFIDLVSSSLGAR